MPQPRPGTDADGETEGVGKRRGVAEVKLGARPFATREAVDSKRIQAYTWSIEIELIAVALPLLSQVVGYSI